MWWNFGPLILLGILGVECIDIQYRLYIDRCLMYAILVEIPSVWDRDSRMKNRINVNF